MIDLQPSFQVTLKSYKIYNRLKQIKIVDCSTICRIDIAKYNSKYNSYDI